MSNATNHFELKILRWLLFGEAMPTFGNLYLAVFTAADVETGVCTEVSGGAYARVQITRASNAPWDVAAAPGPETVASNNAEIYFPTATTDWGSVTHWGLMDAASAGNAYIIAPVTGGAITIPSRSRLSFDPAAMTVKVN